MNNVIVLYNRYHFKIFNLLILNLSPITWNYIYYLSFFRASILLNSAQFCSIQLVNFTKLQSKVALVFTWSVHARRPFDVPTPCLANWTSWERTAASDTRPRSCSRPRSQPKALEESRSFAPTDFRAKQKKRKEKKRKNFIHNSFDILIEREMTAAK